MDTNIFLVILANIASIISTLESYIDSTGVNISNWIVQLVGNSSVEYPLELTVQSKVKDTKPMTIKIKSGFLPSTSKRESANYVGNIRIGNVKNPEIEVYSLLAYICATLLLGKHTSVVNSGRGLILDSMLKSLPCADFTLTIKGYSSGGKDKAHDVIYSLDDIRLISKFYVARSKRITTLAKKGGHTSSSKPIERANVEVI